MAKKASLNLSMNAIVVLILAITMLGLGLTFMRGLFQQATERVTEAVSSQELTNPPTRDTPLTIAPGEVTLRKSEKAKKLLLAFMNVESSSMKCALDIVDKANFLIKTNLCRAGTCVTSEYLQNFLIYNEGISGSMDVDQINSWTLVVDGSEGLVTTATKTHLVSAIMCCGPTTYTTAATLQAACIAGTAGTHEYKKDLMITVNP
tara:strand:+ start:539 stop:1153 length:615 start_codon:yes stop_codon:yes gene_type:complete